jgi:hypothetical protein
VQRLCELGAQHSAIVANSFGLVLCHYMSITLMEFDQNTGQFELYNQASPHTVDWLAFVHFSIIPAVAPPRWVQEH